MKIDRSSKGLLASLYVIAIAISALFYIFVPVLWLDVLISTAMLWFMVWQTYFFRIPVRNTIEDGICSVCDGRVVIVEKTLEREFLNRECIQVSVYMNFFDTHANFWPSDGTVDYYRYVPGKHLLAFNPKASLDNEHTCTKMTTHDGQEVFFKQIAGGFARRISNYATIGEDVRKGDQCGIIKFGSRIDLFLPLSAKVEVKVGDIVRACETRIATLL